MPFDFYLEEHNTCIEYDGKQHYEFNNFFGGINAFKEIKNRDTIEYQIKYSTGVTTGIVAVDGPFVEQDSLK